MKFMFRLYISGPISDEPDHRKHFYGAERRLLDAGYEVVNPLACAPIKRVRDDEWLSWMRGDIAAMMTCDGVATLDNHFKSRGAGIETDLAFKLGLPVASVNFWAISSPTLLPLSKDNTR